MNLEELKRLLAEATKGPWDFFQDHTTIRLTSKNREGRTIVGISGRYADSVSQTEADFRLMAAAVNALPELIGLAEWAVKYRARVDALEEHAAEIERAYAAGRADQRKADVEIAKGVAEKASAALERCVADLGPAGDGEWLGGEWLDGRTSTLSGLGGQKDAAESIAKAIEEQGE